MGFAFQEMLEEINGKNGLRELSNKAKEAVILENVFIFMLYPPSF